jgi:divalent metal cation (Fe/Co/Zn/Cd) transporter
VLLANAYHHRGDAHSNVVALVAIFGSGWFPALPLDPIGGAYIFTVDTFLCSCILFFLDRFLVSIVIFQQDISTFKGAFYEMTDASGPEPVLQSLSSSLDKLREDPYIKSSFLHVRGLRARRQAHNSLLISTSVFLSL